MPSIDPEARRRHNATYYAKNRERVGALNAANRRRVRQECQDLVWEYLETHPCVDCGESDPVVLEFDHREGVDKSFNIGAKLSGQVYAGDIAREIRKCDVRCANCHRQRTARAGKHWRSLRTTP